MLLGSWLVLEVSNLSVQGFYMRHCSCLFLYCNIMIWKKSRIKAIQMDNLRGWLDIRGMDEVPNAWIRKLHSDKTRG